MAKGSLIGEAQAPGTKARAANRLVTWHPLVATTARHIWGPEASEYSHSQMMGSDRPSPNKWPSRFCPPSSHIMYPFLVVL